MIGDHRKQSTTGGTAARGARETTSLGHPENLIPSRTCDTGDYFCTWKTQNVVCGNKELKRVPSNARDSLGEELLFGEVGALKLIPPEVRGDLIVVIDDGWDVPYGLRPDFNDPALTDAKQFGSLCLDETRFPTCTGTPQERLKALSDRIKALGYIGPGLWIAPQEAHKDREAYVEAESERYWIERLTWCRYADIKYWKIDWGLMDGCDAYRKMLDDLAKTYAPGLKIEQAYTQGPFDEPAEKRRDETYQKRLERLFFLESNGDYIRTYDTVSAFFFTTSVNRTVEMFLAAENKAVKPHCTVCAEDCVYLAAALGCSFGAMRLPGIENDPAYRYHPSMAKPQSELKRSLMWHRFAPPFAIDETPFVTDKTIYRDSYFFPQKPDPKPWPQDVWGTLKRQDSYAGMSRNMPLAKVDAEGEKPYVVCARNPRTNAVSVFAAPRTIGGSIMHTIRADIGIQAESSAYPVGIFGHYKSLTVSFADTIRGKRVFAQDLAASECVEITDRVGFPEENKLKIDGSVIDEIGLSVRESETELPGLVVVIR